MSGGGLNDTIAADATAPGEGSVSIIRISGEKALSIADQLLRCALPCPSERPSHTVIYGHVMDGDIVLDEALCLVMRGPNSYTREDVVEIQGHGGSETTRRVLRACLEAGARLAEPGEFTKRAFLNGRIDLTQAEAVLDLVQARSDRAATAALEQLRGGLSQTFDRLYEDVLMETARLEAALDFPEDELPETVLPNIATALGSAIETLDSTLSDWDEGTWLRDGILVVISGQPNVGKSTLLNALLKQERAIVTDIPGTTRDAIEESFILEGFPVRIVDTAGLRETDERVEQIGIERARKVRGEADFHLVVYDSSQAIDLSLLESLRPDRCLIILNKADLAKPQLPEALAPYPTLRSAILLGQGVDEIRAALRDQIASRLDLEARPHAVISERHRELLIACRGHLADAKRLTETGDDEQIFMAAASARDALEALGEATGKVFHEALLDRIFSSFCIGK